MTQMGGILGDKFGDDAHGILADGRTGILQQCLGSFVIPHDVVPTSQSCIEPERMNTTVFWGIGIHDQLAKTLLEAVQGIEILSKQAIRRGPHPSIGMAEGLDQRFRVFSIELEGRQGLCFLGLNPVEAGEMMIAVRTAGGITGTVGGTAGIVMNGNLVVEIDEVQSTIGSDS